MPSFFCMPFFACNRQVDSLDKRQCNLQFIPHEIERYDRSLEELLLDMNHIEELPKSLFRLQKLRRLGLSDNDIHRIPSAISGLQNLIELNVSRNDISDIPEELKACQNLSILDISSNPIARLPDSITNVSSLTSLSLNDTSLTKLPQDIGKLVLLKSLEVRENHLRSLPSSIDQLTQLLRLDLGQNELEKLPNEIGSLCCLEELYVDDNSLERLPDTILQCKLLEQLDVSSNRLLVLPTDLGEMVNLVDLTLSHNCLSYLPNSIGQLKKLTILRLDDNSILQLTPAIGSCTLLNELNLMQNLISDLPSSLGNLNNLQNLNVDKNQLTSIPALIGNCSKLTLLSLRDNQIKELPMEIGKLAQLRVLDVCNNRLFHLPFTINVLYNLQALWLSENQSQALLKLQQDVDQKTGMKVLTCYLLPQQSSNTKTYSNNRIPNRSFVGGPKVHFGDSNTDDFDIEGVSSSGFGNFERHGTPHPKSNSNNPVNTVTKPLKKQSIDGHIIPRLDDPNHHPKTITLKKKTSTDLSNNLSFTSKTNQNNLNNQNKMPRPALKHSTSKYYYQDELVNQQNNDSGFASSSSKEQSAFYLPTSNNNAKTESKSCFKRVNTPHYGKNYLTNNKSTVSNQKTLALNYQQESPITVFSAKNHSLLNTKINPTTLFPTTSHNYYQNNALTNTEINLDGMLKIDVKSASLPKNITNDISLTNSTTSFSALPLNTDVIKKKKTVTKQITVYRDPNYGLGLSIAGGIESNPYIEKDSGLFISKLIPNAPAEKAGLKVGDKVLEINGSLVINERHDVAVQFIQKSPEVLNLVVLREETLSTNQEIDAKNAQLSQGTNYTNDKNFLNNVKQTSTFSNVITANIHLNENGQSNLGVRNDNNINNSFFYISSIFEEAQNNSEQKRNIEVGDKILSINGQNIQNKNLDEVLMLLQGKPGKEIYLVLERTEKKEEIINQNEQKKKKSISTVQELPKKNTNEVLSTKNSSYYSPHAFSNEYKNIIIEKKNLIKNDENNLTVADLSYGDCRFDNLIEEVELIRDNKNALGLSIVGGIDHCSHPFGVNSPGVFISKIAPNSPAANSKRLRVGDRILKVNGKDVSVAKHSEAVEVLKTSGSKLYILIKHDPQPKGLKELLIQRKNNQEKLGITICGGINSLPVITTDPTDEGIFIEHVDSKGCGGDCSELKVGQRILEVNGDSLLGCTKHEAAEMLKSASSTIRLLICDGFYVGKNGLKKSCSMSSSYTQNGFRNSNANLMSLSTTSNDIKSTVLNQESSTNALNLNNSSETTKFATTLSNFSSINNAKKISLSMPPKFNHKKMSSQNQYPGWSLNSNYSDKQHQNYFSKNSSSPTFLKQNLINEKTNTTTITNAIKHIKTKSTNNFCTTLSDSITNCNVDNNSIKQKTLKEKELEQQKRHEWRQARLASIDAKSNHTEEIFINLKELVANKLTNLEKNQTDDCCNGDLNTNDNENNNKLIKNLDFYKKFDLANDNNANEIKFVDA